MKCTVLFVLLTCAFAPKPALAQTPIHRPKLVVGIVVDQMRWDYLYRYYDLYGEGGFKRLLREGYSCENTSINYLPAATAVGHSSIFTGSVPAIHGIADNEWVDQLTGITRYCVQDNSVHSIGSDSKEGEMSPRNLLASTITDELMLATNFRSKVVGISLKDRASILPAGHMPTGAFWFDDADGRFITSSYYMDELPQWVKAFNAADRPGKLVSGDWSTLYPMAAYTQSTGDDVPWEGRFKGEAAPVFPHRINSLYRTRHTIIRSTPFGNTLTLEFAAAAIDGYRLGRGPATDFLTINCASTDYVGHMYGPNAIEMEDTYLRLDKDLAAFFTTLDAKVGKGNYLVFLTADHGASHAIDFNLSHRIPAGLWSNDDYKNKLNKLLKDKFNTDSLVLSIIEYQVNYDQPRITRLHLDFGAIKSASVDFLKDEPGVLFAVDMDKINDVPIPDVIKTKLINGYNYKRSGPVIVIPSAGWLQAGRTGTSHGEWNPYDAHIPLIFSGWNIKHGYTTRAIDITDIAPTVSALLHIQAPNGCIGKPITEITNR